MAKARLVAIVFSTLIVSTLGWAQTPTPSLVATPPQPKWSELSVPQRIVLAPLADDWDSMENYRQKKWLGIAARFPVMTSEEQRRIQGQMQDWGKLTPEQRALARENFKTARQLPPEQKQQLRQKWEEYSSLPAEEKERLKQQAKAALAAQPTTPAHARRQTPALPVHSAPTPQAPAPEPSTAVPQTIQPDIPLPAPGAPPGTVASEPPPAVAAPAEAPAQP